MRFWALCHVNTLLPSPTKPLLKPVCAEGYLSGSFEEMGALPYEGTRFQVMGWAAITRREHHWWLEWGLICFPEVILLSTSAVLISCKSINPRTVP